MSSKSRFKMSKKGSKKLFSKTANKTNVKNVSPAPQRGGYRL